MVGIRNITRETLKFLVQYDSIDSNISTAEPNANINHLDLKQSVAKD